MPGFLTEGVLVAIITSLVTGIATIVSVIMSSRLTVYRIEQLERTVEKYNGMREKVVEIEQRAKSNTHRINDLEDAHGVTHREG